MGSQGERRGRDWRGAGGIRFRCRTGGGSSGCGGDPWGGKSGVGLGEEDEVKRAGREQATHTHPSGPWKYARSQILQLWTCLFRQTPSQSPRPHGAASRDQISKDPNGNPRVLSSDTPRTLFLVFLRYYIHCRLHFLLPVVLQRHTRKRPKQILPRRLHPVVPRRLPLKVQRPRLPQMPEVYRVHPV